MVSISHHYWNHTFSPMHLATDAGQTTQGRNPIRNWMSLYKKVYKRIKTPDVQFRHLKRHSEQQQLICTANIDCSKCPLQIILVLLKLHQPIPFTKPFVGVMSPAKVPTSFPIPVIGCNSQKKISISLLHMVPQTWSICRISILVLLHSRPNTD